MSASMEDLPTVHVFATAHAVEAVLRAGGVRYARAYTPFPVFSSVAGGLPALRAGSELAGGSQAVRLARRLAWGDAKLPPAQEACMGLCLGVCSDVEEWAAFGDDARWEKITQPHMAAAMLKPLGMFVPRVVRNRKLGAFVERGMDSDMVVEQMAREAYAALCACYAQREGAHAGPFFGGADANALDAVVYAHLAAMRMLPVGNEWAARMAVPTLLPLFTAFRQRFFAAHDGAPWLVAVHGQPNVYHLAERRFDELLAARAAAPPPPPAPPVAAVPRQPAAAPSAVPARESTPHGTPVRTAHGRVLTGMMDVDVAARRQPYERAPGGGEHEDTIPEAADENAPTPTAAAAVAAATFDEEQGAGVGAGAGAGASAEEIARLGFGVDFHRLAEAEAEARRAAALSPILSTLVTLGIMASSVLLVREIVRGHRV